MLDGDLTQQIIAAMNSDAVTNNWIQKMNATIDKKVDDKLKPVQREIANMKEENKQTDCTIANIEAKIDDQEMTERDKNIIAEGLKESTKEGITDELNELLDLTLQTSDIAVLYRITPRSDTDSRKYKTKIIFEAKNTKEKVMKGKAKTKGKRNMDQR